MRKILEILRLADTVFTRYRLGFEFSSSDIMLGPSARALLRHYGSAPHLVALGLYRYAYQNRQPFEKVGFFLLSLELSTKQSGSRPLIERTAGLGISWYYFLDRTRRILRSRFPEWFAPIDVERIKDILGELARTKRVVLRNYWESKNPKYSELILKLAPLFYQDRALFQRAAREFARERGWPAEAVYTLYEFDHR